MIVGTRLFVVVVALLCLAAHAMPVPQHLRSNNAKRMVKATVVEWHEMPMHLSMLQVGATYGFDGDRYARAVGDPNRRRMVPYGGFDSTLNPYRRPNNVMRPSEWFTPKWTNLAGNPDGGINIAQIAQSQTDMLNRNLNPYASMGAGNTPGYTHSTRLGRSYGVDTNMDPVSYYSPPPISTAAPAAAKTEG